MACGIIGPGGGGGALQVGKGGRHQQVKRKSTTKCRRGAHTTQTKAGSGFQNSAAAGMCRRRRSWQGAPVHPSSALSCSPHIVLPGRQVGGVRPLPRTFRRSRWGQNSKLRWHRAAPVHHCSRWLSKAKKGLGGGSSGGWRPEHQLQPPHHITQMCLCHRSTKNFCQAAHISPPLLRTDSSCCRF